VQRHGSREKIDIFQAAVIQAEIRTILECCNLKLDGTRRTSVDGDASPAVTLTFDLLT